MANTVKTYRVLRDGMRVGDDVRQYGDFMPEAAEFPNLRSYIGAGFLEEVFVEKEALDKWVEERVAQQPTAEDADEADETPDTENEEPDGSTDSDEGNSAQEPEKPKKTVRKRAVKKSAKKAVKKTAKSRETEKSNGRELAEQDV